jgi:CheY-like chemotaxis protein
VDNLLSNAVKFTPPGGSVDVQLTTDSGTCVVSVTDTGIGIVPEFLPHVFERFRQADGSMTREHGGLGLGLAIVKELVELHGGTVHAGSPGRHAGATFVVTLPHYVGRVAVSAPVGPVDPAPPPRLDGIRVPAVDDNADTLDIVNQALSAAGATVRTAHSGQEAIGQWRKTPSDVLLCDLAMPGMDGFAVLDEIRQLERGRRAQAIAVTAYASDEYRRRCASAGFELHVAKPYNTAELIRAVARVVNRAPR